MPTEIALDRPPAEAERLVAAALANIDGIADVARESDVVVGRARGGLTSGGETVNVYLQPGGRTGSETTLSVWAEDDGGFVTGSDPWKYKNAFVEELRSLRELPDSELPSVEEASHASGASGSAGDDEVARNENAVVWLATAKLLAVVLVFLLAIVGVVVLVALV